MKKGSRVILAIDLGGSKYMVGLISDDGEIIKKKRYEWRSYDADEIIKQICTAVDAMRQGYPDWHPELIGMTIPGLADAQKGIWKRSGFMGVRNLPIAPILQETYQMPTFIDNDCRACALAEKRFGTARDCDDFFYITVSNGIGGALFLNGKLYTGAGGSNGEIGQIVVEEGGRSSHGRLQGTLEAYASARGLMANYLEAGGWERVQGKRMDGRMLSALADEGDSAAKRAFERQGYYLGKALAMVCNLLDPERIVIGGGLSLAFRHYRQSLEAELEKGLMMGHDPRLCVLPSILGYEGALLGAAAVALRAVDREESESG